jgi:alcohol dehydrogenase class IV
MMDSNTKDVLMAIIALISAIVTPLIVLYVNNKTNKKVDVIETKLDESHKQMNGNLDKLIKASTDLATATEKAKNIEQQKHKDK